MSLFKGVPSRNFKTVPFCSNVPAGPVSSPSQEFCNEVLDLREISDYYVKYKELILFQVNKMVHGSRILFENIKDEFHGKQLSSFKVFASQLEQGIPFESLDDEHNQ